MSKISSDSSDVPLDESPEFISKESRKKTISNRTLLEFVALSDLFDTVLSELKSNSDTYIDSN